MKTLPEKWKVSVKNFYGDQKNWFNLNSQNNGRDYHNYKKGWLHFPIMKDGCHQTTFEVDGYTEITFEDFKRLVLNKNKTIKHYKTSTVLSRDITLCVAIEGNNINTGYSVRMLNDKENVELGKRISFGRANNPKTNLTKGMTITDSLKEKYILAAIANKLLTDIEQGKLIIKGIR